jgi:hypothetical protein
MHNNKVDGIVHNPVKAEGEEKADEKPDEIGNPITRKELVEQLEAQIAYFEALPQHEKFSFCTNADLAYFMLLVCNIVKAS